jgi:hypothetical protein
MSSATVPWPATASDLVTPLRCLFAAVQTKSSHLAQHIHPAWVSAALPNHGTWALHVQDEPVAQRVSHLLGNLYGVRWPALASLHHRVHRVALLTKPMTLRVLAGAALYLQRGGVRHCVGRQARQALEQMVGVPALAAMLNLPAADRTTGNAPQLSAADLEPELWAAQGYRVLHAAGVWTCKDASVIARLSLSPGAFDEPAPATEPKPGLAPTAVDLVAYLNQLEHYFPEQSWLFGSNMDRALSVLTTGSSAALTSPP